MKKNGYKYECLTCNFKTLYKSNFQNHLITAKHKMETSGNKKMGKNGTPFTCSCGKEYKTRSGLWKHKIVCNKHVSIDCNTNTNTNNNTNNNNTTTNNNITTNKDQLILDLLAQNKELISILNDTVPKIGNNNNNNTTNNNNFNLQVFLNEDCKDAINFSDFIKQIQVSFEDIENQAECGYVKGISKLFIENLQELGTYKRPIHCTDKKRKTLYIKENDEWDKEGSQDTLKNGIQEITRSTMRTLIKEKVNRAEEFADMESDFSKQCLVIQRNLIPTAPREKSFSKVMENITKNSGIIE